MPTPIRVSPFQGSRLAKAPGGGLQRRILDHFAAVLPQVCIAFNLLGISAGLLLGVGIAMGFKSPAIAFVLAAAIALATLLWMPWRYKRFSRDIRNALLGLQGERAVAARLAELGADGYIILHDLELPAADGFPARGNIDHVAIGPAGVICIETKTRAKVGDGTHKVTFDGQQLRVNGHAPDRDPIAQVRSNAQRLAAELARRDLSPALLPLVLFEGWWVESRGTSDVKVANTKQIFGMLRARPSRLSPADIKACFRALEKFASTRPPEDDDEND